MARLVVRSDQIRKHAGQHPTVAYLLRGAGALGRGRRANDRLWGLLRLSPPSKYPFEQVSHYRPLTLPSPLLAEGMNGWLGRAEGDAVMRQLQAVHYDGVVVCVEVRPLPAHRVCIQQIPAHQLQVRLKVHHNRDISATGIAR